MVERITNALHFHQSVVAIIDYVSQEIGQLNTFRLLGTHSFRREYLENKRAHVSFAVGMQCVCSYFRVLALRYIMFDLNEVSLEEIVKIFLESSLVTQEDLLHTLHEAASKILPFLTFLYVIMMSLVVIIGNLLIINRSPSEIGGAR